MVEKTAPTGLRTRAATLFAASFGKSADGSAAKAPDQNPSEGITPARLLKRKAALQKQAKEFGKRQEDCGHKTPLQEHLDKQKYQEFLMDIAERRAKQRRAL